MKKVILAILLMFSVPAFACDISASGLDKEALAQLKVACEQAKLSAVKAANGSSTSSDSMLTPERISAIGQVSQDIAKAIGTAASELGVAVNDFLLTPAGVTRGRRDYHEAVPQANGWNLRVYHRDVGLQLVGTASFGRRVCAG